MRRCHRIRHSRATSEPAARKAGRAMMMNLFVRGLFSFFLEQHRDKGRRYG